MLTYATFDDYRRMKKIESSDVTADGRRVITDYLKRATQYIDRVTRRRFFPFYATRVYMIPASYADLNNRVRVFDDLSLDNDLLEPRFIQTGGSDIVDTYERVPSGGMSASASTWTAVDVTLPDAQGVAPRIAVGDMLQIDNERLRVLDVAGTTVTVQRGILETVAVAHAEGVFVYRLRVQSLVAGLDYHLLDLNYAPKYGIRLVWPNAWGGLYAGATWRYRYPQIYITGYWGYHESPSTMWIDTTETLPGSGLSASATTWTATDVDGSDSAGEVRFEAGSLLRIGDEMLWVMEVNTTTNGVTVLRGQHGTAARAHSAGTAIYRYATPQTIRECCATIAKTWRDAGNSVGGRQGVTEVSTGVEISVPKDVAEMLRMYIRAYVG